MFAPTRAEELNDCGDVVKSTHDTAAAKKRGKSTIATDNIFMAIDAEKIESQRNKKTSMSFVAVSRKKYHKTFV